jgi:hypothetical protein
VHRVARRATPRYVLFARSIIQIKPKPILQLLDSVVWSSSKALEMFIPVLEHFHEQNDFQAAFAQRDECSDAQLSEYTKQVTVGTVQEVHKIASQLERSALKANILSR